MTRRALVVIFAALLTVPATAAAAPTKGTSVGVFYQGTGYLVNRLAEGPTDITYQQGWAGTVPVAGDWDGNGTDGIGVYANGVWYLVNDARNGSPPTDIHVQFGIAGDKPFVGDFNGDGKDDIGVYRWAPPPNWIPSIWMVHYSPTNGEVNPPTNAIIMNWGTSEDLPVAGDWDGNGPDGIGFFRPSTAQWFFLNNVDGRSGPYPDIGGSYGSTGDQPIAGDWDGDGKDTPGVFKDGNWYLVNAPLSPGWLGGLRTGISFMNMGFPGSTAIAGDWDGKAPQCRDGFDNDGDGMTDWPADANCSKGEYDSPEGVSPVWTADAEQPTSAEWASLCTGAGSGIPTGPVETQSGGRITRDTSLRAQGASSYRIEVRPGDTCGGTAPSERAELGQDNPSKAGFDNRLFRENEDRWISWQVYLPPGFPINQPHDGSHYQDIAQWHQQGGGGPPLFMAVNNGQFQLRKSQTVDNSSTNTDVVWSDSAVTGRWVRFTLHVKFSPNQTVGFVELYSDLRAQGQQPPPQVLPRQYEWTMKIGGTCGGICPVHSRIGIYRGSAVGGTSSAYFDGYTVATTRVVAEANAFRP
jgi:hypothetical protein